MGVVGSCLAPDPSPRANTLAHPALRCVQDLRNHSGDPNDPPAAAEHAAAAIANLCTVSPVARDAVREEVSDPKTPASTRVVVEQGCIHRARDAATGTRGPSDGSTFPLEQGGLKLLVAVIAADPAAPASHTAAMALRNLCNSCVANQVKPLSMAQSDEIGANRTNRVLARGDREWALNDPQTFAAHV